MREIVALALAVKHAAREEGIFQEPSELDDNIAGLLELSTYLGLWKIHILRRKCKLSEIVEHAELEKVRHHIIVVALAQAQVLIGIELYFA